MNPDVDQEKKLHKDLLTTKDQIIWITGHHISG